MILYDFQSGLRQGQGGARGGALSGGVQLTPLTSVIQDNIDIVKSHPVAEWAEHNKFKAKNSYSTTVVTKALIFVPVSQFNPPLFVKTYRNSFFARPIQFITKATLLPIAFFRLEDLLHRFLCRISDSIVLLM